MADDDGLTGDGQPWRGPVPLLGTDEKMFERFMAKVNVTESCWLWTASTFRRGYGQFELSTAAKGVLAHRLSWEIFRGPIPDGLCVCHNCPDGDNPRCVNPAHLWLGTHTQNIADREAKGRTARGDASGSRLRPECLARGDRNGSRTHPERLAWGDKNWTRRCPEKVMRGETHGGARLNDVAVRVIRFLASRGRLQRDLAAAYGIRQCTVSSIVRRASWAHVS